MLPRKPASTSKPKSAEKSEPTKSRASTQPVSPAAKKTKTAKPAPSRQSAKPSGTKAKAGQPTKLQQAASALQKAGSTLGSVRLPDIRKLPTAPARSAVRKRQRVSLPGAPPVGELVRHLKIKLAGASGIVLPLPSRATPPAPATAGGTSLVDYRGTVIKNVTVQLVFWGSAWAGSATPTADEVTDAVKSLMASSYMSALHQYRGIQPGKYRGRILVTNSNPPNPFSNDDVSRLITRCFEARTLPEPETDPMLLYCVIMPPGVAYRERTVIGEHSFYWFTDYDFPLDLDINKVHYAWVMNDGTLPYVTRIFSHELVEAVTDPGGNGFQLNAPGFCSASRDNWCEIGDVCSTTDSVNGVTAQSYWSHADHACVVPGAAT